MDGIARAVPDERADLFRQTAARLRPERSPEIIEKDFWVCWALRRIFEVLRFNPRLIFKGGTSLSKAYNLISRFSEDVDLSLSRNDLGFAGARDPEEAGISRGESKRRLEQLTSECQLVIHHRFLPDLRRDFASVVGASGWSIGLDPADPQTALFAYPRSGAAGDRKAPILQVIRLEMGARSDEWPAESREIRPYAAEAFPEVFAVAPSCTVHTLEAVRTF